MSTFVYSMACLLIGAGAAELDHYFGTSLFFWLLMATMILSGLWVWLR